MRALDSVCTACAPHKSSFARTHVHEAPKRSSTMLCICRSLRIYILPSRSLRRRKTNTHCTRQHESPVQVFYALCHLVWGIYPRLLYQKLFKEAHLRSEFIIQCISRCMPCCTLQYRSQYMPQCTFRPCETLKRCADFVGHGHGCCAYACETCCAIVYLLSQFRGVAQLGSASALGAEGRWFESSHPDQFVCGGSSIGRAVAFQATCCGFESRPPLHVFSPMYVRSDVQTCIAPQLYARLMVSRQTCDPYGKRYCA